MANDSAVHETPTRRDTIKYGGAVVGGGLLAGCTGNSGSGDGGATGTPSPDDNANSSSTQTGSETAYEVCLPESGCVEFDDPPETYMTNRAASTGMLVALGEHEGFTAIWAKEQIPWEMYEEFPEVEVSVDGVPQAEFADSAPYLDKEWFYELDSDVHVLGPKRIEGILEPDSIEEIWNNVGPFFFQFGRRPGTAEEHGFAFLGLYPIFEKVAQVFQAEERYEQLHELSTEFIDSIQSKLPKETNKPSVAVISIGDEAKMNAYIADQPGWGKRQYRTLQVKNAFADQLETGSFIETDFEALLEADPDIIFELSGFFNADSREEFEETVIEPLEADPVASKVTAVEDGAVFASGNNSQGPVLSLLQTEVLAKQLHPEIFGGPRTVFDIGTVPDEPLFDRQRVADIINGDI